MSCGKNQFVFAYNRNKRITDGLGGYTTDWSAPKTVKCKISYSSARDQETGELRRARQSATMTCSKFVTLKRNDRIKDSNGADFEVIDSDPEVIGSRDIKYYLRRVESAEI